MTPIAPHDACEICNGSHWTHKYEPETQTMEEVPCPKCNELGFHAKVYY